MFSFLGLRKDSKKSTQEKEADGFVILGETAEEKRQKVQIPNVYPATNVIVLPSKSSSVTPAPPVVPLQPSLAPPVTEVETAAFLPELLGDVPFMLAPHILAMQAGLPQIPEALLPRDTSASLARFRYDFTLENSVLCDS
ncbi:UBAP1-MVB12-associated (UMA)-domain containing protein 1 [Conger conger]|nr:UBAP1-MVB12-associated (UMA)-domain containing protein 1 [Conger conger]